MRIVVATEAPQGACSFYRSLGVLPYLNRIKAGITIESIAQIDWYIVSGADIIFLERPSTREYLAAAQTAKDLNIKLWCDFDDDFFNLPQDNPSYPHYFKQETQTYIKKILKMSDVVTVATNQLKTKYSQFTEKEKITVIPNAFNDYIYTLPDFPSVNRIINWRGSNTHRNDLRTIGDAFERIVKKYPDWLLSFMGYNPWFITEGITDKVKYTDPLPISVYNKFIKNMGPAIQIHPLVKNEFNLSKSNVAWIEGTYSGSVFVGPNMPEFNKPGIEQYDNPDEFVEKIIMFMSDSKKRDQNYKLSLEYIKDNLLLSEVNKKRMEIIDRIL